VDSFLDFRASLALGRLMIKRVNHAKFFQDEYEKEGIHVL